MNNIPFLIKRFYIINQILNPKAIRGNHAHKTLNQIIFCIYGSFRLHLDDGRKKRAILIKDLSKGIYLKKKVWHSMTNFSKDCAILVVADNYYDEHDYIRDYNQFLKFVKK